MLTRRERALRRADSSCHLPSSQTGAGVLCSGALGVWTLWGLHLRSRLARSGSIFSLRILSDTAQVSDNRAYLYRRKRLQNTVLDRIAASKLTSDPVFGRMTLMAKAAQAAQQMAPRGPE